MTIKFKDPSTMMSIEIDLDRQRKIAHQEFLERRPTKEEPAGFGPSEFFNQSRDDFMAKRKKHTHHLQQKITSGEGITQTDIEAAKRLEIIEVESRFDHKSDHCRDIVRGIERGSPSVSGQSHATWKAMEIKAKHQGQMNGDIQRDQITIEASHRPMRTI